jgi:hypothetical protein
LLHWTHVTIAAMHLHHLEKKYGIRINLFDWSGDDYETGTLNALIKIEATDVGRILLESIAYQIRHNPGNAMNGILEVRPYAEEDCNASTEAGSTTKRGHIIKPVVHFWPKAYAQGGACSKYLEDHKDETGGILPDETLFHEFVHAFRMASGAATVAPLVKGGLLDYQDAEEFIAVLVTNIYLTDPSNKTHSNLRRDHVSFKTLESDLAQSFTFFRSSVSTYRLVEKFCKENPAFTKNLARVKASFNPIAAFYKDPMQAWLYANSEVSESRDALGPESWDNYQELRKYSATTGDPDAGKAFLKRLGQKAPETKRVNGKGS